MKVPLISCINSRQSDNLKTERVLRGNALNWVDFPLKYANIQGKRSGLRE